MFYEFMLQLSNQIHVKFEAGVILLRTSHRPGKPSFNTFVDLNQSIQSSVKRFSFSDLAPTFKKFPPTLEPSMLEKGDSLSILSQFKENEMFAQPLRRVWHQPK